MGKRPVDKKNEDDSFSVYIYNLHFQISKFLCLRQLNELNAGVKSIETVYLLSDTWWKSWKKYISFDESRKGIQRASYFGAESLKPSTIKNYVLVDIEHNLCKTTNENDPFNVKLKQSLKEGTHYVVLHENEWKFLSSIYGFDIEIARYRTIKDGKASIEAELKIIPYAVLPTKDAKALANPFKIKLTQISKYKSAFELKNRILNIETTPLYGMPLSIESMKLYICNTKSYNSLGELLKDFKKNIKKFQPVEEGMTLENLEIFNSFILIESTELDSSKCDICPFCKSKHLKGTSCTSTICKKLDKQKNKKQEVKLFKPNGIKNIGNTCYIASTLQSLLAIKSLNSYFKSEEYIQHLNKNSSTGGKIGLAFAYIVNKYWQSKGSYTPKQLKTAISLMNPIYAAYTQQDAAEFLMVVLDLLHDDLNTIKNKHEIEYETHNSPSMDVAQYAKFINAFKAQNASVISSNFMGAYKCTITCGKCSCSSNKYESYNMIPLSIPTPKYATLYILSSKDITQYQIEYYDSLNPEIIHQFTKKCEDLSNNLYDIYQINAGAKKISNESCIAVASPIVLVPVNLAGKLLCICVSYSSKLTYSDLLICNSLILSDAVSLLVGHIKSLDIKKSSKEKNSILCTATLKHGNNKICEIIFENDKHSIEYSQAEKEKYSLIKLIEINIFVHCQIVMATNCTLYPTPTHHSLIPNKPQKKKSEIQLMSCYNQFSIPETLEDDNLWYCNNCNKPVEANKIISVYSLPKTLILSLKRFQKCGSTFTKLETLVTIPPKLKLFESCNGKDKSYSLISVVHHFGALGGGHYISDTKINDDWYEFSDTTVTTINPKEIESSICRPSAYILFYVEDA